MYFSVRALKEKQVVQKQKVALEKRGNEIT